MSHGSLYTPGPGKVENARCGVCQEYMLVTRNTKRSYKYNRGSGYYLVDWFECKYRSENWHKQAEILTQMIQDTPSNNIATLLRLEVDSILSNRKATIERNFVL